MNNTPNYEYAGIPLSLRSTKSLIIDIYAGKKHGISKDEINREIEKRHLALNGESASRYDRNRYVSNALKGLPNADYKGRIKGLSYWRINHLELGTGNKWVYCFYFTTNQYSQYRAIRDEKWCWKCNIGRTGNNPFDRIRAQTIEAASDPIIPLLIRTDDEQALERHIHDILKERGRHLRNTNTNEDFITCPSEIARIVFESPRFRGKKIPL